MKQNRKKVVICAALACIMGIHTGFISDAAAGRYVMPEAEKWEKAEAVAGGETRQVSLQKAEEFLRQKREEERLAAEEAQRLAEQEAQEAQRLAELEAEEAQRLAAQEAEEAQDVVSTEVTAVSGEEADLLAALIYCEAGGEPYEGQVAVGAVVMNRVNSPAFPDSISDVIYQSGQFGPAVTGKLSRVMAAGSVTDSCYRAAQEALAGNSPVGDAVYFGDGQNYGRLIGGHWFHS